MKVDLITGDWDEWSGMWYKCPNTNCVKDPETGSRWIYKNTNYCPMCGIKLEWEEKDHSHFKVGDTITPIKDCMNNFWEGKTYEITEDINDDFVIDGVALISKVQVYEYFVFA